MMIGAAAHSLIGVSGSSPTERTGVARARRADRGPPAFADILCAVDGSHGSRMAIHQATCLCEPGSKLRFVVVDHEAGTGPRADSSEMRARTVLDEAMSIARGAERETSASLLHGAKPGDLLLDEADGHDLLVVGSHGGSRLGCTATQLADRAKVPLLVARRTVDSDNFPQGALLATNGSAGSWAAARVATRLAKARGSELRLVHVPDGRRAECHREVLKQRAVIERVTGARSSIADSPSHVADRICETANGHQASLVVIGRSGLSGGKALGSVSERVVHRVRCSVLVVPVGEAEPKRR
jgi:nucleotide-binding universal stress UspA family protein